MPLHMRMPKHGFKSRKKINKIVLKTDLINNLIEKKKIKENSSLTIKDLVNYSSSKNNVYIKFLMGKKLSKSVNIESHGASESVKKEFKRVGATINLVEFKKRQQNKAVDHKKKDIKKSKVSNETKPKLEDQKKEIKVKSNIKSKTKKNVESKK